MNYGITGYPLGHSLSPLLHNWALTRAGLSGRYDPYETKPEDLAKFIQLVRQTPLYGVSVTVPHKVAVMSLLDGASDRAILAGAVNTLYWNGSCLLGENTDVIGFTHSLSRALQNCSQMSPAADDKTSLPGTILILGAGGAARGVLCGLLEMTGKGNPGANNDICVAVAARNPEALKRLSKDFDFIPVSWPEREGYLRDARPGLVVNTTPLGMFGAFDGQSPVSPTVWTSTAPLPLQQRPAAGSFSPSIAFDLVYNPLHTPFLRDAEAAGWHAVSGLDFFAAQGIEQFRIWTGHTLPQAEAASLLRKALSENRP